jgi:N-sulfoglucosamine sulfohydrolase
LITGNPKKTNMPTSANHGPSRRTFLGGVAAGSVSSGRAQGAALPPPNIIYIHSHDSGRYLQPYGYPVPTPNIQSLAREGVLFRRAFSAAPTCSPSRAALLTGQCPHQNGMLGLAPRGFKLKDYRRHILYSLRDAGYLSVLAGLQHIAEAKSAEIIGYDEVLWPKRETYYAADVVPQAIDFMRRRPSKPFFMDIGFKETHRKFPEPTPGDDPRFLRPPSPIPDTPETRSDFASYCASARRLDWGVGQILEALDRTGLAENTLVISTTDHGVAFPRMKCNLTDDGFGVSLIMRGPASFSGGKVCDALISQIDLYPTICELLQVSRPAWLEGKSFLPVLRGEIAEINEEIFAEVNYHASYEPKRAVRTGRWKYIRRYGDRTTPVLSNCDDSPSKRLWLEHGWRGQHVAQEQLYDLLFDPHEHNNLASDRSSAKVLAEMQTRLNSWMVRTDDPLLRGPVPAPQGALITPPDSTSAGDGKYRN